MNEDGASIVSEVIGSDSCGIWPAASSVREMGAGVAVNGEGAHGPWWVSATVGVES